MVDPCLNTRRKDAGGKIPTDTESPAIKAPSTYLEIGVGLGKATFDATVEDAVKSWPNSAEGIDRFLNAITGKALPPRVNCEATGGYTHRLIVACIERDIAVSLLNAHHVRSFGRARSKLAKTDRIDAHMIARSTNRSSPMGNL